MAQSGQCCRTAGEPSDTPGWAEAEAGTEERRDTPGWDTARRMGGSVCTPGLGVDKTGSEETGRAGSTAGTQSTGEAGEAGVGSNLTDCQGSGGLSSEDEKSSEV